MLLFSISICLSRVLERRRRAFRSLVAVGEGVLAFGRGALIALGFELDGVSGSAKGGLMSEGKSGSEGVVVCRRENKRDNARGEGCSLVCMSGDCISIGHLQWSWRVGVAISRRHSWGNARNIGSCLLSRDEGRWEIVM